MFFLRDFDFLPIVFSISFLIENANVQKILWKDLQLRGLELRIQEEKLVVKGEVLFLVIYEGEEETNADNLVKKFELFGDDPKSLYMLDNELGARVYAAPSLVL